MSDDDDRWWFTQPSTRLEWSVPARQRPCWRCRLHLRWPPWQRHWECRKPPRLIYVDLKGGGDE